jgi:ABC-2 type transport system permease protein
MMLNLIKAEWIKLRTVRVNVVLASLGAALPLAIVVLVALLAKNPQEQQASELIALINVPMVITSLLFGVIGALNLTGEFSHGTIRNTFAATPQRRQVLIAKAIVGWAATTVFAGVIVVLCFFLGSTIFESRDAAFTFESHNYQALLGVVVLSGLLSLLGFGFGLLIRNSPATVVMFVLWIVLIENLIGLVMRFAGVDNPENWLPVSAAFQMVDPDRSRNASQWNAGRWDGGIYLGAVVLVMIIIGIIVNERRDA